MSRERSAEPAQSFAPAADDPVRRGVIRTVWRMADSRTWSLLLVFILLAVYFHIASRGIFFSPRNISLLLRQASIVAVPAAGVSILIVMGEIDLSIGSSVYLCSVVAASMQAMLGSSTMPTVLATIAVGMVLGAWQGLWVVVVSVPSFVVTLAGLLAFRGIGYWASDAQTIGPVGKTFGFLSEGFISPKASYFVLAGLFVLGALYLAKLRRSEGVTRIRTWARIGLLAAALGLLAWAFGGYLGIPVALVWVAAVGLALSILMIRTKFGRNSYLIGSNREASILAGIHLRRHLFLGFVLMGVLYGVSAVLITARLGAATASSGLFMELDAIAGAVIGGTSLRGGVGTIAGAMVGAVLLTTIDNGMSILNVSAFLQMVVKGFVLLSALTVDSYMLKRRRH